MYQGYLHIDFQGTYYFINLFVDEIWTSTNKSEWYILTSEGLIMTKILVETIIIRKFLLYSVGRKHTGRRILLQFDLATHVRRFGTKIMTPPFIASVYSVLTQIRINFSAFARATPVHKIWATASPLISKMLIIIFYGCNFVYVTLVNKKTEGILQQRA